MRKQIATGGYKVSYNKFISVSFIRIYRRPSTLLYIFINKLKECDLKYCGFMTLILYDYKVFKWFTPKVLVSQGNSFRAFNSTYVGLHLELTNCVFLHLLLRTRFSCRALQISTSQLVDIGITIVKRYEVTLWGKVLKNTNFHSRC